MQSGGCTQAALPHLHSFGTVHDAAVDQLIVRRLYRDRRQEVVHAVAGLRFRGQESIRPRGHMGWRGARTTTSCMPSGVACTPLASSTHDIPRNAASTAIGTEPTDMLSRTSFVWKLT